MPRPPRDRSPGLFHVGVSAAGPVNYFRDEVDHLEWTRRLVRTIRRHGWTCLAFCELSTHWHALIEVGDDSLSRGMHYLNSAYTRAFNARHGRVGYFVRDRFWSRRKSSESELLTAYRYVVNNPVEAGAVARAEDWYWSSYATTLGVAAAFPFVDASRVLGIFGPDPAAASLALCRFVAGL
jgi:putative transposase